MSASCESAAANKFVAEPTDCSTWECYCLTKIADFDPVKNVLDSGCALSKTTVELKTGADGADSNVLHEKLKAFSAAAHRLKDC